MHESNVNTEKSCAISVTQNENGDSSETKRKGMEYCNLIEDSQQVSWRNSMRETCSYTGLPQEKKILE